MDSMRSLGGSTRKSTSSRFISKSKFVMLINSLSMYKMEDQKFVGLQNTFEDYLHETSLIEKVFVELIEFIDGSSEA